MQSIEKSLGLSNRHETILGPMPKQNDRTHNSVKRKKTEMKPRSDLYLESNKIKLGWDPSHTK